MSKASRHFPELAQTRSSAPMFDKYAIVPISACVFALIASPIIAFLYPKHAIMDTDYVSRIF
jgi:hypothetical protein